VARKYHARDGRPAKYGVDEAGSYR